MWREDNSAASIHLTVCRKGRRGYRGHRAKVEGMDEGAQQPDDGALPAGHFGGNTVGRMPMV